MCLYQRVCATSVPIQMLDDTHQEAPIAFYIYLQTELLGLAVGQWFIN